MITMEELSRLKQENEDLKSELARERAGGMKLKSEHERLMSALYKFAGEIGSVMEVINSSRVH